ncbi:MAG: 30S ribosomal protein S16 [Deltaproteobacteria bacterium]|nr:30S ribosomal protein S16 [Deltaproteobacteria bacterium]
MAVHLRLSRAGKPKHPFYRIVATDSRTPRDGRFLEVVGTYHPRKAEAQVAWQAERVRYWLSKGARPTQIVHQLLQREPITQ